MDKNQLRLFLIIFVVLIFLLVFGIRYLKNKENMALIERGMMPSNTSKFAHNWLITCSFLLFGFGFGLLTANFAAKNLMSESPLLGYWVFISIFLGAALFASFWIQEKKLK